MAEDTRLRHYIAEMMSEREPAKEIRLFGLLDYLLQCFSGLNLKFRRRKMALRNHEQLMAERGLYARMFDTQAAGYR